LHNPFYYLSSRNQGRILAFLGAVSWSLSGSIVKSPVFDSMPEDIRSMHLAFWRGLFVALLFLPSIRKAKWHRLLIPLGFSFLGMSVFFMSALVMTTAATALWLQNIAPVWVALFSIFLFKEKLRRQDYLPLGICVAGVFFILSFQMSQQGNGGILAAGFAVASGLCYAMVICLMRSLREFNSFWLVFACSLLSAIVFLPVVLRLGYMPNAGQLSAMLLLAITSFGLPYSLFAKAMRRIPASEGVIIALSEPILAPVWVWLLWRESEPWFTLVGGAIILTGLVLQCLTKDGEKMKNAE
jgi:drug/metabolite transporter (DMT)-like permease